MTAKTAFYRDKFDTTINNSKQLWINLSKIGSLGKTKTKTTRNAWQSLAYSPLGATVSPLAKQNRAPSTHLKTVWL